MSENRLKISNPERILRILQRISEASLPVMVRIGGTTAVSVKGRAAAVAHLASPPSMRISNVSEQGLAHLVGQTEVQIEFIMMATKVVFMARVLVREQNSLTVSLPSSLISIERRKNARFACTDELTAYLDVSKWRPSRDDHLAQPIYAHQSQVASYLAVADLSHGGLCAVTRFPSSSLVLKRGIIDDSAKVILPLQEPLAVSVEIRWIKKIKESVQVGVDGELRQLRSYRFGIEFVNPSDEVRLRIRQFLQQLSQAGAI